MIFAIFFLIYCNDNNFLGGGSFYPSNTLDRTLSVLGFAEGFKIKRVLWNPCRREAGQRMLFDWKYFWKLRWDGSFEYGSNLLGQKRREAGSGLYPSSRDPFLKYLIRNHWLYGPSVAQPNRSKSKLKTLAISFAANEKPLLFNETSIIAQPIPLVKSTKKSTQTFLWSDVSAI